MADNQSTVSDPFWKQHGKSGVYLVTCTANSRIYVGSAIDIAARWYLHTFHLRNGKHANPILQRAWKKYGADAFEFSVIEYVPPESLIEIEQKHIDAMRCCDRKVGFNIAPKAGSMLGYKHTAETREKLKKAARSRPPASAEARTKIALANTGRVMNPEHVKKAVENKRAKGGYVCSEDTRALMSVTRKGRKHTAEARANMSASRRGKKLSPVHCARIAEGQRGKVISEESRRKMSEAHRGKKLSEEHKAKLALAGTGRRLTDEEKEKIAASKRGKPLSQETKAKLSLAATGQRRSEETREKMRNAQRDAWARRKARASDAGAGTESSTPA